MSLSDTINCPSPDFLLLSYTSNYHPRYQLPRLEKSQRFTAATSDPLTISYQPESQALAYSASFWYRAARLAFVTSTFSPNMLGNPQNSSALTMARLFKKVQSEVQQEATKPNMMKKFGGKFKKAFSKKKQVRVPSQILYVIHSIHGLTV